MKRSNLLAITGLSLAAAASVGCGPNLKAVDRNLDFGDTFVGLPVTRSTAWVNRGGEAHIKKVVVEPADAFTADASELTIDPELSRNERSGDVAVTFDPKEVGVYRGTLSLDSNGQEQEVELRGRGVYVLSTTATSISGSGLKWDEPLDHGSVPVAGGEAVRRMHVTNRTNDRVEIDPHWTRGQQGFTLRGGDEDFTLNPGESRELTVVFDPEDVGTFQDTLVFRIDDRDTRAGVVVTGKGTR